MISRARYVHVSRKSSTTTKWSPSIPCPCGNSGNPFRSRNTAMPERRHPDWIKVRAPTSPEYHRTKSILAELKLHSVCQEAACPNIGECFSHHTATFMLR